MIHAVLCLVSQLCLTLLDSMDHSLPDSSVHGILQARILEWVTIPFSRGYSQLRDQTWDLLHCRLILYHLSHQRSLRQKYIGTQNFTAKIWVNYLGGLKLQARYLLQSGSVYIMPAETKAKTFCRRYLYLRPDYSYTFSRTVSSTQISKHTKKQVTMSRNWQKQLTIKGPYQISHIRSRETTTLK